MASILVVDDEVAMRELYHRLLLAQGHLALDARTAEEALDLLAMTDEIAVVVADLQMPGKGGEWLVTEVRQRFPTIAVVLATAEDTVSGTLSLQPSVVRYLVKPISGEQLVAAVEQAITWHEQQVRLSRQIQDGADPIESWLDKKLTRGPGDGDHSKS
jgi:DNA-binding NtrC family response regulator